jgi:glycosyltransferase involved in cell wall biosynthesis
MFIPGEPGMPDARIADPALTILLSTYNGARFLRPQLASFCTQSFTGWTLYWRDDGSTDDSVSIMRAFAAEHPAGRVVESPGSGPHLGASPSFLTLLAEVEGAGMIAFADQDDVWLIDKLRDAVDRLHAAGDRPALYCARQYLVNERLEGDRLSVVRDCIPGFPACLTQNVANGNTLVMNQEAARIVASMGRPEGTVHDWWSYITVAACGGEIIFDERPAVLYRLHKNNLIGSARPLPARAVAALQRGPAIFMTMLRRHAEVLALHQARLAPQARRDLARIRAALDGGMLARINALRCPGFQRRTPLENILFAYWFVTDSLPPAAFAPIEAARAETQ